MDELTRLQSLASPWPSFSHSLPGMGRLCMFLILLPWRRGAHKGSGAQVPTPRSAFLWRLVGLAGGEGRFSHPFRNMKFFLNYSLSFKIPPPFSWFPTLTDYQAMGTIPPTLDSCEDPGKVSTLTGAPARQSPRDPRGPAWPLAGSVLLSRLSSQLGLSLPILENEEIGQGHFKSSSYQHLLFAGHCLEDLAMARSYLFSPLYRSGN